jgi:hypothetical protein
MKKIINIDIGLKFLCLCLLSSCNKETANVRDESASSDSPMTLIDRERKRMGSLIGGHAGQGFFFSPFSVSETRTETVEHINPYLWQASFDVLSFMPLVNFDSKNGMIVFDWYQVNNKERIKVFIHIQHSQLKANSFYARIYKQQKNNKDWVESSVSPQTITELERSILIRARNLYIQKTNR